MAGSHTMMPGILYTNTTVLNVTSTTSGIPSNQQGITFPINHSTVNGAFNINGHANNIITATGIHRTGNKITIQGTTTNSNYITSINTNNGNSNNSNSNVNNEISCNGIIEKSTGHTHIEPSNSLEQCLSKPNNVEIVGISDIGIQETSALKQEPKIEEEEEEEQEPVIDIMINNVVCSFSVGCHLNLRNIALAGRNVEFRKENAMVTLKLRRPPTTASIWSSGKITCTGSTSGDQARTAARRVARSLQKLGYNVRFRNFRIVNVLGTCTMPFAIRISQFSQKHRQAASYEPELHPGVTYRIEHPKACLKIFSTGSITVTAPSIGNVQSAIETIYPLVKEFSKQRSAEELMEIKKIQMKRVHEEIESDPSDDSDDDN